MPVGVIEKDKSKRLHINTYTIGKTLNMVYRFCDVTRTGTEMLSTDCDADDSYANEAGVYLSSKNHPVLM